MESSFTFDPSVSRIPLSSERNGWDSIYESDPVPQDVRDMRARWWFVRNPEFFPKPDGWNSDDCTAMPGAFPCPYEIMWLYEMWMRVYMLALNSGWDDPNRLFSESAVYMTGTDPDRLAYYRIDFPSDPSGWKQIVDRCLDVMSYLMGSSSVLDPSYGVKELEFGTCVARGGFRRSDGVSSNAYSVIDYDPGTPLRIPGEPPVRSLGTWTNGSALTRPGKVSFSADSLRDQDDPDASDVLEVSYPTRRGWIPDTCGAFGVDVTCDEFVGGSYPTLGSFPMFAVRNADTSFGVDFCYMSRSLDSLRTWWQSMSPSDPTQYATYVPSMVTSFAGHVAPANGGTSPERTSPVTPDGTWDGSSRRFSYAMDERPAGERLYSHFPTGWKVGWPEDTGLLDCMGDVAKGVAERPVKHLWMVPDPPSSVMLDESDPYGTAVDVKAMIEEDVARHEAGLSPRGKQTSYQYDPWTYGRITAATRTCAYGVESGIVYGRPLVSAYVNLLKKALPKTLLVKYEVFSFAVTAALSVSDSFNRDYRYHGRYYGETETRSSTTESTYGLSVTSFRLVKRNSGDHTYQGFRPLQVPLYSQNGYTATYGADILEDSAAFSIRMAYSASLSGSTSATYTTESSSSAGSGRSTDTATAAWNASLTVSAEPVSAMEIDEFGELVQGKGSASWSSTRTDSSWDSPSTTSGSSSWTGKDGSGASHETKHPFVPSVALPFVKSMGTYAYRQTEASSTTYVSHGGTGQTGYGSTFCRSYGKLDFVKLSSGNSLSFTDGTLFDSGALSGADGSLDPATPLPDGSSSSSSSPSRSSFTSTNTSRRMDFFGSRPPVVIVEWNFRDMTNRCPLFPDDDRSATS